MADLNFLMTTITCETRSGQPASAYPTTMDYLRDIVGPIAGTVGNFTDPHNPGARYPGGFTEFYLHIMQNSVELNKHIDGNLQLARPVRNLVLNAEMELTADKWVYNTMGMFVTVSGRQVETCEYGRARTKRFSTTVVAADEYRMQIKGSFRSSCNCCMFNGSMTHCSYYQPIRNRPQVLQD